jgi:predicted aspartyl protease
VQYNSTLFDPPCPAVDIRIETPISTGKSTNILAQIDTGADLCVIPLRLIRELDLQPYRTNRILEHNGKESRQEVYRVRITISDFPSFMVDTVYYPFVDEDDYLVLGREALNIFRMLLDGPEQQFSFLQPETSV